MATVCLLGTPVYRLRGMHTAKISGSSRISLKRAKATIKTVAFFIPIIVSTFTGHTKTHIFMITANELRIGNVILHFDKEYKVTSIKQENSSYLIFGELKQGNCGNEVEAFEPIILSSELLTEKCGFLSDESGKHWVGDFELFAVAGGFEHNGKTILTSVHHIQNLYYFTEGSELPVNF